jgi:PAS domain S-box-containing protein
MVIASNVWVDDRNEEERQAAAKLRGTKVDAADLGVGVLFDRLLDAVVIARLSTGRIVLWNAAAETLFGYSAGEAIGQSIEMLMPQPIADLHRAGLDRYVRTGHGLIVDARGPVEMPARNKRGEEIRVELTLSELLNSSGERFAVAIIRDALLRKRFELTNLELAQARVARSEAEAELAARDELLDAVATTLQTGPEPDELRRLSAALDDFRRLHGGQLTVRPQDADLVDFVHTAADEARSRATGRRVLVSTPPTVPAIFDLALTREILEQILDEALQRSSDGSRIYIQLEQPTAQIAQLSVRAEGAGAARELGVGLHLSRTLIQRQGGSLHAAVTPSGGLEIVVTLPGCPRPVRRRPRRVHPRQASPSPAL